MIIIIIAIAIGSVLGIIIGLSNRKLLNEGVANKNRPYNFYKKENLFKTSVLGFDELLTNFDTNLLSSNGITMKIDNKNDRLLFSNTSRTFTASLRLVGPSEDGSSILYSFRLNSWESRNNSIVNSARMDANIVLTTIEKAFLKCDYNALVERTFITDTKVSAHFF